MRIFQYFDFCRWLPLSIWHWWRRVSLLGEGKAVVWSVHRRGKHLHGSGHLRGKPSIRLFILCQPCGNSFEEAKFRELSWSSLPFLLLHTGRGVSPECLKSPRFAGAGWLPCSTSGSEFHGALVALRCEDVISYMLALAVSVVDV